MTDPVPNNYRPITVILDGSNYTLWARHMTNHLKAKMLWKYIIGTETKPIRNAGESDLEFMKREEIWDCKNGELNSYFCSTTTTEINQLFVQLETGKEIWDFLKARYTTSDLAHQYQLWSALHGKRQQPSQSISSFHSEMKVIWDQMDIARPVLCSACSAHSNLHHSQHKLVMFLMALDSRYEHVRASLLHRSPLPTLDAAISELISEETRLGGPPPLSDSVLLTHRPYGNRRFQHPNQTPKHPNSVGKSRAECSYCHSISHMLLDCPVRICKHCNKQHPRHYHSDCPKNPNHFRANASISSHTHAGNTSDKESSMPPSASSSTSSMPAYSHDDVIALLKQVMSSSTHSMAIPQGSQDKADLWDRP